MLAALSDGPSHLWGALFARDTELMMAALRSLGVVIDEQSRDDLVVTPPASFTPCPGGIDCGLAGNVMRFVPALAALAPGQTAFFGDPAASGRPVGPLLDGLRQLGVRVDNQSLPFTLDVPDQLPGREVTIDASTSSQYLSALLLSGARYPRGLDLRHNGDQLPSLPHIAMTVQMLRDRGVRIDDSQPAHWIVESGPVSARDLATEPDLTNAAAFLAAGVLSHGVCTVPGWPLTTSQPGAHFLRILDDFGATTSVRGGRARARWCGPLRAITVDLHAASELTPVVSAVALFAQGPTTIRGVAHIRGHETDRLAAISAELRSLGAEVDEFQDGLTIHGVGDDTTTLRPTRVLRSSADHRIAQLAALVGLRIPGVQLDDVGCTAKTMPDFPQRWSRMMRATQ